MQSRTINDLTCDLNVLLACHEHENIAWRQGQVNLQYLLDCTIDVVLAWRLRMEDLDRESTTWNGETRGIAVKAGELHFHVRMCHVHIK